MKTISIAFKDNKYLIYFFEEGIEKWQVSSYTLLDNLPEIIYLWCEKGEHPSFRYT